MNARSLAVSVLVGAAFATQVAKAEAAESLVSASAPVSVVYDDASDAELAAIVLEAGERAWKRLVDELGWAAPWTDRSGQPERGMTIRVGATGIGPGTALAQWGSDIPATSTCDCSASIVIDRATAKDREAIAETVLHEMIHTSQYATDCTEEASPYESFAVAAQAMEFPRSTMVRDVVSQFQKFPEYPLDFFTMKMPCDGAEPCFPYHLGAALFPLYLVERFEGGDPRALASLFATFGQDGTTTFLPPHPSCSGGAAPSFLDGVRAFVEAHGVPFEGAFEEFTRWRAVVGASDDGHHFAQGASLPEPAIAASHDLAGGIEATLSVREYGTRYVLFEDASRHRGQAFDVEVDGDPTSRWVASVLVLGEGRAATHAPLVFAGSGGSATVTLPEDARRALLVVSQLDDGSHAADAMDFESKRRFRYAVRPAVVEDPAAAPPSSEPARSRASCASGLGGAHEGAGVLVAGLAAGVARRRRPGGRRRPSCA